MIYNMQYTIYNTSYIIHEDTQRSPLTHALSRPLPVSPLLPQHNNFLHKQQAHVLKSALFIAPFYSQSMALTLVRYVCLYVCVYIRMYVCLYVCVYVCMFVCVYAWMQCRTISKVVLVFDKIVAVVVPLSHERVAAHLRLTHTNTYSKY